MTEVILGQDGCQSGQLAMQPAIVVNSKGHRRPREERQGESTNVFERLRRAGARRKLNQAEDEVNSHTDLMYEEPDRDLELGAKRGYGGGLRMSTLSQQATFPCPNPRDRQIVALVQIVQALQDRMDNPI